MARLLSKRKKVAFTLIVVFISLLFIFVASEATARLLGYTGWSPDTVQLRIEPEGAHFFQKDSLLGFHTTSGQKTVILPDGFTFACTNDDNGLRITPQSDSAKKTIWILGGSYTYGWSVGDTENYPWLAGTTLPDIQIVNYGIPGYGTLQSYLQLQEALKNQAKPDIVMLAYAGFHNQRNVSSRAWRKMLATFNRLGPLDHPYARLDEEDQLNIQSSKLTYEPFPLQRQLALIHFIEENYNEWQENHLKADEVTYAILEEINSLCKVSGIDFRVMTIVTDPKSNKTLEYCKEHNIPTFDITVDLRKEGYTNEPHDSHPSYKAHKEYAEKLIQYLQSME